MATLQDRRPAEPIPEDLNEIEFVRQGLALERNVPTRQFKRDAIAMYKQLKKKTEQRLAFDQHCEAICHRFARSSQ